MDRDQRASGRRRWLMGVLVALSAIGATLGLPASGFAKFHLPKEYTYKAKFVGSGEYSHEYTAPGSSEDVTGSAKASFNWYVVYPKVVIFGKEGAGSAKNDPSDFDGHWTVSTDDGNGGTCNGSGGLGRSDDAPGIVEAHELGKGFYQLTFQPISGMPLEQPAGSDDCSDIGGSQTSDFWQDWPGNDGVASSNAYTTGGTAPFRAVVGLRPKHDGKVIQKVQVKSDELPTDNGDCGTTPSLGITCTVKYDWSGQITLTRKSTK